VAEPRSKLAIVYDRHSVTPLELAEAARPVCELIWVLDLADPPLAPLAPLFRRLGGVLDTNGRSDAEVVAALAPEKLGGVITFAERQMPLAAAIAEAFDLRFHSPHTAALLRNKHHQRVALARAGVPGPAFWPLAAATDAATKARLAAELRYPVVLKPQMGTGSRDTWLVGDGPQLLELLDDPANASLDMLVEELLAEAHPRAEQRFGETLMVDSLLSGDRAIHYAVTGHFIPAPPFRGAGSYIPSHLDAEETAAVLEATEAALAALEITDGFTNTDLIITPDGPRVLEVNGRIGGEVHTLLALAGVPAPLLREAMKYAVGAPDVEIAPPLATRVGFCANYHAPMEARRLLALSGVDDVAALSGVTSVVRYRHPGDALDWRDGTMSRIFTTYGAASDHDQLYELHQQIERCVLAEYELGGPATDGSPG
jgi:biotin carboxylase